MLSIKERVTAIVLDQYRRSPRLRAMYRAVRRVYARQVLKRRARRSPCRIVIGANNKYQEGWIPTEVYTLNMLDPREWQAYFQPDTIDALLAEHVWEHLTLDDGVAAARQCRIYLKPGAHLRVAVPDGNFPDSSYLEFVRPGGIGPSAYDHKVLFTYRTFAKVFEDAGLVVDLLEYYDEHGEFHARDWDPEDGLIVRSKRFYTGRSFGDYPYTSIVLDARKPDDR